tara:strand:+ start:2626 stop:3435 length:810 start_codon:yes stop_codon:yes gene_type:complete
MLNFSHPYIFKGDKDSQLSGWRVSSFDDSNTDRGKVYVDTSTVGATTTVNVYKDADRSSLVATGSGSALSRVALSASNNSGFGPASVYLNSAAGSEGRTLILALATDLDLRERDDRLYGLHIEGETDFSVILTATSREFLTKIASKYPPTVNMGAALRYPGATPAVPSGSSGEPSSLTEFMWTLRTDGVWDLTGMQNPEDYKEWAIYDGLFRIWQRKVRSEEDPTLGVAIYYRRLADACWEKIMPWVDIDYDTLPDRPARVRSVRMRRG